MSRSTISMALAAVGLCSLPAFVPGITGSRAPASSPTLRGTAEGSSTSTFGAAHAAGLALTVVGAAAVKRVSARKALRRELAVAYEDSGIDLLDNGKFAQGLVGGGIVADDVRLWDHAKCDPFCSIMIHWYPLLCIVSQSGKCRIKIYRKHTYIFHLLTSFCMRYIEFRRRSLPPFLHISQVDHGFKEMKLWDARCHSHFNCRSNIRLQVCYWYRWWVHKLFCMQKGLWEIA